MNGPPVLKAGIVGLGVGERHIDGYRRHPACEVMLAADFSPEKRAEVAARRPELTILAEAEPVLDDPAIDIVSVASWDQHHFDQIMRAIAADKHLFVEKPLVLTETQARQVHAALDEKPHLKISSNLILRRCPRFLWLRERMRAGDLGRIYHIQADYQYGRIHKLLDGWRGTLPGYSLVLGGAVHMADLVLWLTGARPVEVSAMGNSIATEGSAFANFDLVRALVRFDDGMVAEIGCNGGLVHPHFHKLEVHGTEASFINGLESAFVYRSRDPGTAPETVTEAYPGVDKGDLLENFVEAVLTDQEPEVGRDAVFSALSLCFAIERAVHSGRPEPVRDI